MNWLLSGTLGLNALVPVGYYNPVISNSSVNGFKENVVIGNKNNPQAGGFVGAQIGAIVENSSVTSTNGFTVQATQYAGGFAGVSRNGNVGGLLNSLGIDLLSALRPQSLIENSGLTVNGDAKITVQAEDYAGGFNGAMANAYAVNNTISATAAVSTDKSHAGGFTGFASVGWGLELGTDDAANASLLKQLTKAVAKLLSGSGSGAGELLSIVGVNPSVILGTQMKGSLTVKAGGDYAGGLVGEGSGTVIGDSSQDHLKNLTFWKYNNPRDFPQQRSTTIEGLESVTATGSYAGGIAGNLQPTTVAGLLNSVVKIGDIATLKKFDQFAAFTVENMSVTAPASGLTVTAGSYYAGGAIGCATGGDVTNTNLTNLATVTAKGEAGGFIGFSRTRRRRWCRRAQCAWAYQAFRSAIGCPIFFGCSHFIECERHRQRIHGQGDRQEREQRDHRLRCGRFLRSGQQHQDPRKPCDEPQVGRGRYQHIRWHRGWFRGLLHHRRPRRRT